MTGETTGLLDETLTVLGRIMPASNHTFLCELGDEGRAVYKPVSGERPLWDFAEGTLASREYAAWLVSEATSWSIVPPTTLREGPMGMGMVQRWIDADDAHTGPDPVELVPEGAVPEGFRHVLDALGAGDEPVSLVHEDTAALRRMAVFDLMVNNTDRKGGHILLGPGGRRYGVDHGVCFHTDDKLRTVLWGWAGESVSEEELAGVATVLDWAEGAGRADLVELLTRAEIEATVRRCARLLSSRRFPAPSGGWPSIPWPPF